MNPEHIHSNGLERVVKFGCGQVAGRNAVPVNDGAGVNATVDDVHRNAAYHLPVADLPGRCVAPPVLWQEAEMKVV